MSKPITIGLVVPFATDEVPFEGPIMYPGVRFIPRGVGVRNLTPEGRARIAAAVKARWAKQRKAAK